MTSRAVGLIFDFDGTLVDTMPIHYEAYRQTLDEVGIALAPDEFYAHVGGTARETIPKFLRGRACDVPVERLHARKQEIAKRLLQTADLPTLAVAELLPVFHGTHPMAVASSGSRSGIDIVIDRLGWSRYFDVIVSGGDVAHGKPAPDIVLLAAQRLGLPATQCIVFEDTDDGVAAARAAGTAVFDVRCAPAHSASRGRGGLA